MATFHSLNISNIRTLTSQAVEITFEVPAELASQYQFDHGQFLMLRHEIDGEQVERAYSICRAPYERSLSVAVKAVEGGVFSTFATSRLKAGDSVFVSTPGGTFTNRLDSSKKKQYLLVAAGSGIMPIISILKMVLASETQSQCSLVYANKSEQQTMFLEELNSLQQRYGERFSLQMVYSQSGEEGAVKRISDDSLRLCLGEHYHQQFDEVFLCGPEQMTLGLRDALLASNVESEKIHLELFSAAKDLSADNDGIQHCQVSMVIDGQTIEFNYEDSTRSLLDVALDFDDELPYGCQNGSCGSCQAKVLKGQIDMEINFALSADEVEQGYALMCQARPKSPKVEISYDE